MEQLIYDMRVENAMIIFYSEINRSWYEYLVFNGSFISDLS